MRELRVLFAQSGVEAQDEMDDQPTRKLTVTATREDGWMLECARKVAEAVAGPMSSDRLLGVLLAEGYSTLLELVPERDRSALYEIEELECDVADESQAFAAWCAERRRWRNEAEARCETCAFSAWEPCDVVSMLDALGVDAEALDREIRRLCSELAERDLALGIVAESAQKAEVWRRLGFATEAQYARERVGVSLSSLKAKRILAARAGRVPQLAEALSRGRVGYEVAYLLSRVVTPATVEAWLRRAEQRTVKHLREEVEAAELLIRVGQGRDQLPLDEESLDALFELERCIVGGDWVGRARETPAGEVRKGKARDASQMSGFARVTLRWHVTGRTHCFWRALEPVFLRVRGSTSFIRFLCENFCRIWLPARGRERPEYFDVYRRDAFRCASPVCTRRDVTPHHLVFRARGGGDEDENVTSLCVWCHLHGIHGGRIVAEPPASRIRWRIERSGTVRVYGRVRIAA